MTDVTAAETTAADDIEDADTAALWNEFDIAEGTAPADQDQAATDDGFTTGEEPVTETPPATEAEPEPEVPGTDTTDTTDDGTDTGAEAPAIDDRWAALPEDARAELARLSAENAALEQKNRSAVGRAGAFQRRYEDLVKAAQPREAKGDRQTPDAALAAIAEDYPEIAKPLTEALKAVQGDVDTLAQAEEGRRKAAETELNAYLDEQEAAFKQAHPDSFDVVKANAPAFRSWIQDQPLAMREAFARNADAITDAAGAAAVIGAFKAFIKPPAAAPAAATTPLSDKRQRQLDSTSNPSRSSRRPASSGIPEEGDPEAIWAAFDALEAR